jgi:mannose-6-phosphate isomerase-like protein (cupin superfamily)
MNRLSAVALVALAVAGCAAPQPPLRWQRFDLTQEPMMQPLLTGAPQSGGMRSGRVVLKPGEAMHRHSTKGNEEVLVFLAGKARVVLGAEPVEAGQGQVLYIPPGTEHEVHNDGTEVVTYVFAVAPVH